MEVNAIGPSVATSAASPGTVGKQQFLELLVAQLANQDPLNPMNDKDFLAQLAQFSGLEQMMEANERLSMLQVGQSAVANAELSTMIGKEIVARSDVLEISSGGAAPDLAFTLDGAATSGTLTVVDGQGRAVRTIDLGALDEGTHRLAWDGKDNDGNPLPAGTYSIRVEAEDANGPVGAEPLLEGTVTAVTFDNGYPEIVIEGGARVRPAGVMEVRRPRETRSATTPSADAGPGSSSPPPTSSSNSPPLQERQIIDALSSTLNPKGPTWRP